MSENDKKREMRQLWNDLAKDETVMQRFIKRHEELVNIGFINHYAMHNSIPNKWFDWERRCNAPIMIIGQDWGPYKALYPYIQSYEEQKLTDCFDYDSFLFSTFSSRTEKFIVKVVESTYKEFYGVPFASNDWDQFFFTVAVMFTRQGDHFRGNEFYDEKFGLEKSLPYLKRQIEIVQPKVIIALGGAAWTQCRHIFQLQHYDASISMIVNALGEKVISAGSTVIIPNYHPASHTNPAVQTSIWKKLWTVM